MMRWALGLVLMLAMPAAAIPPWATATPRPTPRPTYPPAPTRTPSPRATSTPSSQATSTPSPRPTAPSGVCTQSYVFIPSAPILRPAVGQPIVYADGTPFRIVVRLASGEILCSVVRAE